mmetsp:Transcript_2219/g.6467  ORF Transcript_2219/g.6467 Transcript_2219/m.6467 type:complete len:486 (+) Transcript_2219:112-1569(+)|eukprot:CAMPEP_0181040404 /NCGR_PEP_ID=MMETSP1070-20121207/11029_1 /TAXON_ID=265543 /ORGANISM="Minutocellus polymorphus, Strain NH13" /LENGTH=485 /DNA_ID=CAMNT_0023118409 /DNA_START=17 /DNA_END=1474 /DNA_ORIENTATION=+
MRSCRTASVSLRSLLFVLLLLAAHSPTCVAGSGRFLWFSDLHYDPFYGKDGAWFTRGAGCAFDDAPSDGQAECDSPLALINSALRAAKALPSPDFILVTGDLSRHGVDQLDQPEATLVDIFNVIAQAFKSAFPRSSLVFCLGNNDAIADYYLDINDPKIFRLAMNTNLQHILAKSEVETFRRGGYYSRPMRNNVKIIALNTVIYSTNHQPRYSGDDPLGQFAWLKTKLSRIKEEGGHVMIVGHIPPAIGSFRRAQFWQDRYFHQYLALIGEYSDIVSCQLFGHLHSDEFRVFPLQNVSPILLGSSITPIFGGNPSFRVVYYDDARGDIENYDTHYLDLNGSGSNATWEKLYTFREAYGVKNMTTATMQSIVDSIAHSGDELDTFISNQHVGAPQHPCDGNCARDWACILTSATSREYNACARASWYQRLVDAGGHRFALATVAGVLAALAVMTFVSLAYHKRRRKQKQYEDIAQDFNISDDLSLT